jgi:general stress protein 26
MMTTQTGRGTLNSRPMSNNGDVKYDGNSYFFTYEQSQKVKELTANPQVQLSFNGADDLYISVIGKAKLIRAKSRLAEHWQPSLAQWFKEGLETPGIVMIHVKAATIKYWQRNKEGVLKVNSAS